MDDNDTSWPRKEPENWRGFDMTRDQMRSLIDNIDDEGPEGLSLALDEVQGDAQNGEAFLLIRVVDR